MNTLEARRRLIGRNVYKRTTEGNPAIAQGSLARMYPGITMQGWTKQDSTSGAQLFDGNWESGFINVTNGKDVSDIDSIRTGFIKLKNNTSYYFSFPEKNNYYPILYDKNKSFIKYLGLMSSDFSFTTDDNTEFIRIAQYKNTSIVENVMLNEGSTALPYEPYTGGKPSPSPEYPQPITSAGKYNEDTQKYEYEITIANEQTEPDKNQTVTLTADRPLTKWDKLTKKNGVWGWEYGSAEVVLDGGNDEAWALYTTPTAEVISFYTVLYGGIGTMKSSLCDKYINKDYAWNEESLYGIYSDHISYPGRKYFRPPSADVETVEQWKTWLQSNPLTLWYETAEETFVPLSESEQEAMNALYTFRPTTVLSNDAGCNMTLTYKTKKSLEVTT